MVGCVIKSPHLKAMIPWEGLNDMYREVAFHGGIPDTGFYRFWIQGIFARWTDNPNIEDLIQAQKTIHYSMISGNNAKHHFIKSKHLS